MPALNSELQSMGVYASKAISQLAKAQPQVLNLSIGEPEFGPPSHVLSEIRCDNLSLPAFLDSVKRYEMSRGSKKLRAAIAEWYRRRYGIIVDPETEVLVTHGGVEALALATLVSTNPGDKVALTDPSYMLYEREIRTLGREPAIFQRPAGEFEEYQALFDQDRTFAGGMKGAKALIVNSPENPTGYVLTMKEWKLIHRLVKENQMWLIHDEVYDTMSFDREHHPARCLDGVGERVVLVNSFSKKFGMPGLRIGWLVANRHFVEAAAKAHDYLYLSVNILFEGVAERLLADPDVEPWFEANRDMLRTRARHAHEVLTIEEGFEWPRVPHGGMFLFPNIRLLHNRLPTKYHASTRSPGEAVAQYLIQECGVAVVPGAVYGAQGSDHIRMVLCTSEPTFLSAIGKVASASPELTR